MKLQEALTIANRLQELLTPYCDRINIAGGCRRNKPDPHDIEIVCIAKIEVITTPSMDLFLPTTTTEQISKGFIDTVLSLGRIIKGHPSGRMMQIALPEGIMLDLFMPDPIDYIRQYVIRTGSADYSYKVIATGWKKLGWVGSDQGLRKMKDCVEQKQPENRASKWKCVIPDAEKPPVWETEEEFFEWLSVKYTEPQNRNI